MATRYALKKEPDVFNITQLKQAVEALPEEYEISMIDQNLYELCKSEIWTTDLVSQFPTYEDFRRLGIGVVICQNHTILSGASSYTRYRDGIEIQINTRDILPPLHLLSYYPILIAIAIVGAGLTAV